MRKDLYPCRPKHVAWKEIDGKGILLNLKSGAYFEIDPVGLNIWKRCDGRSSLDRIAETLARELGAEAGRVCRDAGSFARELAGRQLLELAKTPPRDPRFNNPR